MVENQTIQKAMDLIKKFEGLRLHAYPDPGSLGEPYTIGYGQTGINICRDTVWTQQQADEALLNDLNILLNDICSQFPLTTCSCNVNQLAAMLSFSYNLGIETLIHVLQEVDLSGFANKILAYDHAGGKKMPGLIKRREAEKTLFLEPIL